MAKLPAKHLSLRTTIEATVEATIESPIDSPFDTAVDTAFVESLHTDPNRISNRDSI